MIWNRGGLAARLYGTTAAAYLLAAPLPAALLFILLQRWFVRGMMEGLKF